MYNGRYIKARISLYNINFYGNKTPRKNKRYTCYSVILLDSIANVDEKYYPQRFLKECNHELKNEKIANTINEELNLNESDDESDNDED